MKQPVPGVLAAAFLFAWSFVGLAAGPTEVSQAAILHFLSHPPSVKELAFRWDGKKGNFQGIRYGTLAYDTNGCFFARYAGDWSEFSNSFVYPNTEMYAQTETGYWHFGNPLSTQPDDCLHEWVANSGGGPSPGIGISNTVAFGSTEAFYAFCYGLPRLRNVLIDDARGTFSGTPWSGLLGDRITGRVTVSGDRRSAQVECVASFKALTLYFSILCLFPPELRNDLLIPAEIRIGRALHEQEQKEWLSDIQIERVIPGSPEIREFRATADYLLGMSGHVLEERGSRTLPIKVAPEVEAAFAGLRKGPPAEQLLQSAQTKAAAEQKVVFVHFGASWCGPCRRLDALLERPELKPVFDKYFVPVKLVVWESIASKARENPGADKLYKQLGGVAGIPFYAFLNPEGALIANPKTFERGAIGDVDLKLGGGIGYPADAQGVEAFLQVLRKAAPQISEGELGRIKAALISSNNF